MKKYIVIPLYEHTTQGEIYDVLCDLDTMGFANQPYVTTLPEAPPNSANKPSMEADGIAYTGEDG